MCMIKEVWKDIPNYEGLYQISNYGRVKSVERIVKCKKEGMSQKYQSYILKPDKSTNYSRITLSKDNKTKRFQVHILLAKVFELPNPNPDKFKIINHITENTDFNHIGIVDNKIVYSSIEWCDYIQNNSFGSKPKTISNSLKRYYKENPRTKEQIEKTALSYKNRNKSGFCMLDLEGNFIREFNNIQEINEYFNIKDSGSIIKVCKGNRKLAYGYKWVYRDEYYKNHKPTYIQLELNFD